MLKSDWTYVLGIMIVIALASAFIFNMAFEAHHIRTYHATPDANASAQSHLQQIGGAVCGADELAVPFYATACAEAKSACGSGCSVWDEIESQDLSGIPGFSDPPLPLPLPPDIDAPAAAGQQTPPQSLHDVIATYQEASQTIQLDWTHARGSAGVRIIWSGASHGREDVGARGPYSISNVRPGTYLIKLTPIPFYGQDIPDGPTTQVSITVPNDA